MRGRWCGRWLAVLLAALAPFAAADGRAEPLRVGLLPVQVHSNEAEADYLSQGLADMLSSRLEQSGQLAVVQLAAPPTTEPAAAREAGRGGGVEYVVFGSFTQFGEGASLDVQCAPVAGDSAEAGGRRIFVSSGTLAEIIPKLDELAEKISRYLLADAPAAAEVGSASGGGAPASDGLAELRRRVDALERAVFYGEEAPAEETDGEPGAASPEASP